MKNIISKSLAAVHTHTHTDSFNEIKNNKEKYKNKSYLSIKNNGGITLVALVVTIVILIILAGISIMGVTQTGIFGKTKLAKVKYEEAEKKENDTISEYEDKMNEYAEIDNSRSRINGADKILLWSGEYNTSVQSNSKQTSGGMKLNNNYNIEDYSMLLNFNNLL